MRQLGVGIRDHFLELLPVARRGIGVALQEFFGQRIAKLRDAPITGMPDALRAFSGVDERRVLDWTVEAMKSSVGLISNALRGLVTRKPAAKPPGKQRKRRPASA